MDFEIVAATEKDAKQIETLYETVWSKYEDKLKKEFFKILFEKEDSIKKQINKQGFFFVAKSNEKVLGLIRGREDFGGVAKISMLCVDPKFRGNGIGKKLLNEFLKKIGESGFHQVYLYTHNVLKPAISLYENRGFKVISLLKNFWHNEDFLLMSFEL